LTFLSQLISYTPATIVYVSCNVATQARDAAVLTQAAISSTDSDTGVLRTVRYRVVDCTPFDLFPQTRHIENVLTFAAFYE